MECGPPPSSSLAPQIKYDVFISFRGSDIRHNFLSHLLKAIDHAKIEAYVDYKLEEGSELMPALFNAIEESQIALIIFSKDYASSRWCLQELAKIHECRIKYGQLIIPIFYNVEPSDVRHQKRAFEEAFSRHENSPMQMQNVEKWRATLKKMADISGLHSKNFGNEAELIKAIVRRVLTRLNQMHPVDAKGRIGIDKPIADLLSLTKACKGSNGVGVVGIWGMGGIGKTTIAAALFNILCSEFEGCHFLTNVKEQSEKCGIIQLRDKLVSILLEDKDLIVGLPNGVPPHVQRRLRRKRILVVLDDVNDLDHVEKLVAGHGWLGPGSRIIITTRDMDVIRKEADVIYQVKALESDDALKLLNLHAFDEKFPSTNLHDCVMMEVVEYAKGIPLALKVLGSFLYSKNVEEWKSQMQKLQEMSFAKIQNVLRLSYEGLDRKDQEIFLYVACFFHGKDTLKYINDLLDKCGYSTAIALRTLRDRALITVSVKSKKVSMHDLIREMGREIVREQNIENPGRRSHLWDPDDICRVLTNDEGTDHIKSISMNMSIRGDLSISNSHCFARMDNLDLLKFYKDKWDFSRFYSSLHKIDLPKGLSTLPNKMKLLHWDAYPLKCLPTMSNAENLVELRMRCSSVEKLWDGVQNLVNLQIVDLCGSEQLIELPDLSKASSLQILDIQWCINLLYIHPSIFSLPELVDLTLRGCKRLEELPDIQEGVMASSSVVWCSKLKHLDMNKCECVKYLPDSLSMLTSLESLNLSGCRELNTSNLHILFDGLRSLQLLEMSECPKLNELPDNFSNLSSLKWLSLSGSNVKRLPESIKHLSRLEWLSINECRRLQSLPKIPPSLVYLEADGCSSLEKVFSPTPLLLQQRLQLFQNHALSDDPYTYFSFKECPKLDKQGVDAILAYANSCNQGMVEINGERERERGDMRRGSNECEKMLLIKLDD